MEKEILENALEDIAEGLGFPGSGDEDAGTVEGKQESTEEKKEDGGKEPEAGEGEKKLEKSDGEGETSKPEGEGKEELKKEEEKDPGPDAPKTWRPEAVKDWKSLPPSVKAEVLKREEDMFKGIEGYKMDAGIGKALRQVVDPHAEAIRAEGVEPLWLIKNLLNAHVVLSSKANSEQKQEIFQRLAQEYGVNMLPVQGQAVDPEILSLKKTVAELRSKIDTTENRTAEQTKQSLKQEIDSFAADPANVHFPVLMEDIALLLRTRVAKDLPDAYNQAMYRNPQTRALEIQRLAAAEQEKVKKAAEEKLQAAKLASAANVKSTPKSGSGTAPKGTMEDTLNETLANIKARA